MQKRGPSADKAQIHKWSQSFCRKQFKVKEKSSGSRFVCVFDIKLIWASMFNVKLNGATSYKESVDLNEIQSTQKDIKF